MSLSTDIVLLTASPEKGVTELQSWLESRGMDPLTRTLGPLELNDVWVTTLKNYHVEMFVEAVLSARYAKPGGVILIIRDEGGEHFVHRAGFLLSNVYPA